MGYGTSTNVVLMAPGNNVPVPRHAVTNVVLNMPAAQQSHPQPTNFHRLPSQLNSTVVPSTPYNVRPPFQSAGAVLQAQALRSTLQSGTRSQLQQQQSQMSSPYRPASQALRPSSTFRFIRPALPSSQSVPACSTSSAVQQHQQTSTLTGPQQFAPSRVALAVRLPATPAVSVNSSSAVITQQAPIYTAVSSHAQSGPATTTVATASNNRPVVLTQPQTTQATKRPLVVVESQLSPNSSGEQRSKVPRLDGASPAATDSVTNVGDKECEIVLVQHKTSGLPVIKSVEGNVNARAAIPPPNTSTPSAAKALTNQSPVASLLSNPNITVTSAIVASSGSKNKEGSHPENQPQQQPAGNGSNHVTVMNNTSRPIRPDTVDLTKDNQQDPPSDGQSRSNWKNDPTTCQVCNKK